MMDIVMIGSGGCMRELAWQVFEDNKRLKRWNIIGYVDTKPPVLGNSLKIGDFLIPYLGDDNYLLKVEYDMNIIMSVGSSMLRRKIAQKYQNNSHLLFPNLILNSAIVSKDLKMGRGCIITMDVRVSTNVSMGNFVFMNTGTMVCHDSVVGDYVTFAPRSQVAGAVSVGKDTEIGMNATIIQNLNIGNNVIVGAGTVLIGDIEDNSTVVGVPARKVK